MLLESYFTDSRCHKCHRDAIKTDDEANPVCNHHALGLPEPIVGKTTGRNWPCPCGSGKKFKKCCINKSAD